MIGCLHAGVSCSAFGSFVMEVPASRNEISDCPLGNGMDTENR
jgi:hypothetical protein